jgi:basic membrane protein A and related proteins
VGASPGAPPARAIPSPTRSGCKGRVSAAFVTDVAGLQSSAEADAYRGLEQALASNPCPDSELIVSRRPSDYQANLQRAAADSDLVIAGSFLLTGAVVDVAVANPHVRFVLVDPIEAPSAPNLAVLSFRRDQSGFLAGALAGLMTRSGIVAGVYGPGAADDLTARAAFERGAAFARPGIRVLGAFQPAAAGEPYNNPSWGADMARTFAGQGADVVFAGSGATGQGALSGATAAGILCIGAEQTRASHGCLIATTSIDVKLAVAMVVERAQAGRIALGLAEHAVGLQLIGSIPDAVRQRLDGIARQLADGSLATGL